MRFKTLCIKYAALPKEFWVRFGLSCANDVKHLVDDGKLIKLLEFVELWLEGKSNKLSYQEIENIKHDARVATVSKWNNLYEEGPSSPKEKEVKVAHAFSAVNSLVQVIDHSNQNCYNVISNATKALDIEKDVYKNRLMDAIGELTELEKLIYLK